MRLLINLSTSWAVVYLLIAAYASLRRDLRQRIAQWFMILALVSNLWELLPGFQGLGWLGLSNRAYHWWLFYGLVVLAGVYLLATLDFLRIRTAISTWMPLILAGAFFWLVVILWAQRQGGGSLARWDSLLRLALFTSWFIFTGAALGLSWQAFRQARRPMHRNRLLYWGLAVAIITLGDFFFFVGQELIGSTLRLLGVIAAGYIVFIYKAVDLRWLALQALSLLLRALLAVALFAVVLAIDLPESLLLENPPQAAEILLRAFLLVFLVLPLLLLLNSLGSQLFEQPGETDAEIVRNFGGAFSNVRQMKKLAKTIFEMLARHPGAAYGYLFLVELDETGTHYELQPVIPPQENSPQPREEILMTPGLLEAEGPVPAYFLHTYQPLTQFDLDFSNEFKLLSASERAWLDSLQADLFVPVFSGQGWFGLLALGPKSSGQRYYGKDLDLLSTLADQAAVALQNTQLFENLNHLNLEMVQTQEVVEKANQDLKALDEAKSAFISVLTHELRTPLANVTFALQILEMYGVDTLLPEQRQQIEQLREGLKQARGMVDNLVTYAAFLNNQMELLLVELDFREVLREAVLSARVLADEKGIKLQVSLLGDLPKVVGDRRLLVNAVSQLVQNAIKFTPKGSIQVSCWASPESITLDVKDTGVGISEEQLPHVWEAFTQFTSDPLRRGVEGLGMGLALVRAIIEAHGGQVWAESQIHQGSTFGFHVPIAGPQHPLEGLRESSQARKLEY